MPLSKDEIMAVKRALNKRVHSYLGIAQRVRADYSQKTIHDFRVASRQLLAIEPLLSTRSNTGYWRKRSRRWLKALNWLRDLQVMQSRFSSIAAIDQVLSEAIEGELSRFKKVSKKISRARFRRRLLSSLDDYCVALEACPKRGSKTIFTYWQQVSDETQAQLARIDSSNIELLHRFRVKYKAFRYLLELLVQCKFIDKRQVRDVKHWQDVLGAIHDLQVAQNWLGRIAGTSSLRDQLNQEMQAMSLSFQQAGSTLQLFIDRIDSQVKHRLQTRKPRRGSTPYTH